MFNDILALQQLAQQVGDTLKDNKDIMLRIQGKANSISRMAKQRIYEYPVVVSNSMGDNVEATYTIVKYAEAIFGYFLMMCMGLEPVVGPDKTIGMHLSTYGTEGFNIKIDFDPNKKTESPFSLEEANYILSKSLKHFTASEELNGIEYSSEENYDNHVYMSNIPENSIRYVFKKGNTGKYYDTITLEEVNSKGLKIDHNGELLLDPVNSRPMKSRNFDQGYISQEENLLNTELDPTKNYLMHDHGKDLLAVQKFPENIAKRMGKSLPTTVTIDLYIGSSDQKVPVTLSVKTIPHIIDTSEMKTLCSRTIMGGSLRTKLIRLRTGELSLFKDIILNLNEIQKDKEFYQRMMRHPWIKQLETSKLKSSGRALLKLIPCFKELMKNQGGLLPSVSLVTTVHEISDALAMPYKDIENRKLIYQIMDNLMLLAMFVYDPEHEMVFCHYSGIDNPYKIPLKDLSTSEKSDSERLLEAMKIMMMNR